MIKKALKIFKCILAYIFFAIPAFVCAMFAKLFVKDLWLISETGRMARDNGYSFFKYLRDFHPKQKAVFVISKKSPDYDKVANIGKTCSFRTFSHWFYYFLCTKDISSHPHFKPGYFLHKNFWPNKSYFLQHGVTKDLTGYIGKNIKLKLFVVSAKKEQKYVIENYGYKDNSIIKLLGLPRHDYLLNANINTNQILFIPTWRAYLSSCTEEQFKQSNYYKEWLALINDTRLHALLNKHNKIIMFYPHIEMQKFIHLFHSNCSRIVICDAKTSDVQVLLKESALLVTDYSSVFFDFAYMKKPVLWYQFDEDEFFKNHHAKGYFDYHDNILGTYTNNKEVLLKEIEGSINTNFALSNKQRTNVEEFFEFFDGKNSERVYQAIKNTK